MNTYGTPRYREINPGLFCIILFPFLVGVMFGDIFHGSILLSLSLYLVLFSNRIKKNSLFYSMVEYRYLLLLMAIFSVFGGLIYNEFTSITFNLFNSCYKIKTKKIMKMMKGTKITEVVNSV